MNINNGDILIQSGEGEIGIFDRYYGKRSYQALRARLTRERCGGDRWVRLWIGIDGIYTEIIDSLKGFRAGSDQRQIRPEDITMDAAKEAARALGSIKSDRKAMTSRENGRRGGRPRNES